MICVVQRVTHAKVEVAGETLGEIQQGMMVLCGFQPEDTVQSIHKMADKLLKFRIFADDDGKMNLNIQQIQGQFLLVPQFTLAADTSKGNRPGFQTSASPQYAQAWFREFVQRMNQIFPGCQAGRFGADMQVHLINDGPVTFRLETY